jgi:molybdopterin molybdotransferase
VGADLMEKRGTGLLSVDQALETILAYVTPLAAEDCPVLNSAGQIAAEDIYAGIDVPAWASSTHDGYAVRLADITGASPRNPCKLKVIGRTVAGSTARLQVTPGAAVRIMTGARMPDGADAVVAFEDTDEESRRLMGSGLNRKEIAVMAGGTAGSNVRRAGEMVTRGALIVDQGSAIGPGEVGLLTAVGLDRVRVLRRPVVAIIPSGEELVEPGRPLVNSQIYNSGSYAVAIQVLRCGAIPKLLPVARDNRRALTARMRRGIRYDAMITCGGSSAGDHDLVKNVVAEMGELVFWKVNMSPGKSFSFGLIRDTSSKGGRAVPHFTLTGNPTGGMINFEVLVRPALLKMQGRSDLPARTVEASLREDFENKKAARCYLWARVKQQDGAWLAEITRTMDKGIFPSIAASNALVIIPEQQARVRKGEKVSATMLDWF